MKLSPRLSGGITQWFATEPPSKSGEPALDN